MIRKLFIFIFIFTFASCKNERKIDISGHWCYFENDTMYNEVLITDSSFLYFSDIYRFRGPIGYSIKEDTLQFFSFAEKQKNSLKYYTPKVFQVDKNLFFLEFKNKIVAYKRLEKHDFSLERVNDKNYHEYLDGFYKRRLKKLYQAGFDIDTTVYDTFRIFEEEELMPIDP